MFVHSVPEGWVGRATAEGLRKGWPDHCEGWTCLAKSDSWISPFLALKDSWYQLQMLKPKNKAKELPDLGQLAIAIQQADASESANGDVVAPGAS